MRDAMVALVLGLAGCAGSAGEKKDRTAELDAAARSFLKAYHAKDVDAAMRAADAPFFLGTLRDPKIIKNGADLRSALKSRFSTGGKFPAEVAKTLTWRQAITSMLSEDEEKATRQQLKPAMQITGDDGGYAALADNAGPKNRKRLAMSNTRLLVGIRDGQPKVVGILID
jgi:hypothetical protein